MTTDSEFAAMLFIVALLVLLPLAAIAAGRQSGRQLGSVDGYRRGYQDGWMEALRQVSAQQVAAGGPAPQAEAEEEEKEEPEKTAPVEEPQGRLARRWARRRQAMEREIAGWRRERP